MGDVKKVRLLTASDIECRVGTLNAKGMSLLLYKDARVDMKLLDEVFGYMNWKRSHEIIDGNLYCTISIWDENKKEWVSKQDVGTESNTEKEKGQASDSFKRAGFNWGIGRELYTAPFIWVKPFEGEITGNNGRFQTRTKFAVKDIGYNPDREINKLVIIDDHNRVRFSFGSDENVEQPSSVTPPYESDEKEIAMNDIRLAKTVDALTEIYNNHSALHNDKVFMALLTQRKNEIKKGQ